MLVSLCISFKKTCLPQDHEDALCNSSTSIIHCRLISVHYLVGFNIHFLNMDLRALYSFSLIKNILYPIYLQCSIPLFKKPFVLIVVNFGILFFLVCPLPGTLLDVLTNVMLSWNIQCLLAPSCLCLLINGSVFIIFMHPREPLALSWCPFFAIT